MTACGFQPMVGTHINASNFKRFISIDSPKSRNEFIVREYLYRALKDPIESKYLLSFSTDILSTTGIVTKNNQTTRYILNAKTNYTVKNSSTGFIIHNGTIFGTSSYSSNINTTSYSSNVSKQNSLERLSKFTAEKIITEIEMYSNDWVKKDEAQTKSN